MARKDAREASATGANNFALKLHLNWGQAPAHRLAGIGVDSEGGNHRLLSSEGVEGIQRKARQALGNAPHHPAVVTPSVPAVHDRIQVGPFVLGDVVALQSMHMRSKYSSLARVSSTNPLEVWGASAGK